MAYDVERPETNGLWNENLSLDAALRTAGARHLMGGRPVEIRNRETGKIVRYNRKVNSNHTREQAKKQIDAYARKLTRELTGTARPPRTAEQKKAAALKRARKPEGVRKTATAARTKADGLKGTAISPNAMRALDVEAAKQGFKSGDQALRGAGAKRIGTISAGGQSANVYSKRGGQG